MPAEGTWFGAAIGTVITPLKDIFFKHAMYCFNPGKYVEDYRRDTMTLIGRQTGIQGEINTGEPNGLIATPDADYWVKRANQAISEEATNREQYEKRGRFFCCGSLNCCANYKIAKRAVEASREVSSCLDSIPSNATARKPPPPVQYKSIVESPELPGHETILKTACESINNQVRIIGIWGPDGVGNTHLLKKINNSFVGSDPSHFVIFVTASSEFSVQNMQDQIIQRLELRKDDVAANPATNISELLRARDFLLLVDGLYEKLDLQAVGIPHPLGIFKGFKRKVVITSQSKKLCDRMGVDEYIEVPCFEESKALELFKHKIGRKDIYSDRHIGALAHCLVNELKGVPSELIHFGEQMVGKNDPLVWEDVIRTVRKSNLQNKDPTLAARTLRNLEDATSNLVAKINDIRNKIKVAEGNGMVSTNEVDKWLEKADTINADVQIIFAGNKKLKKDVTREAIEKLSEVQECLRSCPNNGNIAFKSVPPPAQEKPGPSMSAPNDNLKKALQLITDDPVGMIGIAGSGGIGKTYLLNSINNSIANAGGMSFQVIFVTASKGCSVKKIQESILVNIGLEKGGNVESRSKMIFNFLKKGSFLLLLDDVWEKIDLHAVGVPYPLGIVNQLKRKVVLTTRLQNVIREMKVGEKLNVVCLQEDEAWQLFQENVSEITLSSDPRIKGFARVLMKELKGLPLALEVIGSAMRGKNDPLEWEYAIQHMQLSRCEEGEGGMKTVFKQLKFSYDRLLNDTLRDCFVTWALWPEDCKIPKLNLAQCWMGLGLVDEGDIESSYRKAYSLIGQLRDASLIESCGSWYGYVKMHDVMRDMALWISCGCGEDNDKWFVHAGVDEHKLLSIPWSKVEYISLMKIQMNEFPPSCFNSCTIELKMLCLRSCRLDRGIARTIKNFTSLTYLDLSMMRLQNIPNELCSLVDLEHLDLSHNDLIAQVPHCFGNLVKLKFLYLQSSGIGRIPKGVISNFQALQVIDLRTSRHGVGNCNHAVFRELGDLRLQAASIEACGFNRYESLAGAAKLPIRSLTLNGLNGRPEFCLSDLSSLGFVQRSLYELEIKGSRMKIIIVGHELAQPDYHFPTLNKINLFMLVELKEIRWAGRSPESVFPRLTYLVVAVCPSLEHLSWVIYLPYLEQLEIRCCATMKQAFLEPIQHGTFPCLKHLRLRANLNLVTIGDAGVRFPSLELLEVSRCPELKMLPFQMDSLPLKLQELRFDNSGCWEKLELEDGVKSFLQPTLKFGSE